MRAASLIGGGESNGLRAAKPGLRNCHRKRSSNSGEEAIVAVVGRTSAMVSEPPRNGKPCNLINQEGNGQAASLPGRRIGQENNAGKTFATKSTRPWPIMLATRSRRHR